MVTKPQDHEAFFQYTSGRWLWDEQARLKERYRRFNVEALQQIAASSVGAGRCVSMNKLAEGASNRIFRLVMDNDAVVIARIPMGNTASFSHTVASEVATMDFASTILDIPVPKVLSWSAKADNPVQSDYILMEEAAGIPLWGVWGSMDTDAKAEVVGQVVSIANKLLSLSFTRYGSIYFSEDRFPGCQPAVVNSAEDNRSPGQPAVVNGADNRFPGQPAVVNGADKNRFPGQPAVVNGADNRFPGQPAVVNGADKRTAVTDRYVIGPVTESSFWDGERAGFADLRGPWSSPQEYLDDIAVREITWLSKYADLQEKTKVPFQALTRNSPEKHIALYQKFRSASQRLLPADPELVRPTLWHWDLHAPNIFVTDNKVTGVIDWQDCWVGPLLLQVRRPRLVDFRGDFKLKLPPHYKGLEEGPEKEQIRSDVERSLLLFLYESKIQRANPELERLFHLPEAATIRDTILFAANTWDGGIIPFCESLVRIFRHWKDICPDEECPFTFTKDELETSKRDGAGWNENAEFWSSISGLVGRDGFVLTEDYDEALEMFRRLREDGLRIYKDEEFDRATAWARR